MGSQPLDDIRFWADQKKACGLGTDQLAAMMLTVIYPEAGASGEQSPSPMTLSRYDTQSGLYAFGDKNTPWQRAFWHPGVGLWAFDSAGGWDLTAVGAISTWTAAAQAATVMSSRWCANPSAPTSGLRGSAARPRASARGSTTTSSTAHSCGTSPCNRSVGRGRRHGSARTCTLSGHAGVLLVHRSGTRPRRELVGGAERRHESDHRALLRRFDQRTRDAVLVGPGHRLPA